MPLTLKQLANGQLPGAKATLYTVPALTSVIFLPITLVNTGAADVTVNLYKKVAGGTSRRVIDKDYSLIGTGSLRVKIGLGEAGAEIEGDASVAAVVDYVMDGVART